MTQLVRAMVTIVLASLIAWQGVLLSIPHDHADHDVPQEELLCSASHPSSENYHLHASGRHLSPHPCIACLAGSTAADVSGALAIAWAADHVAVEDVVASDLRSRYRSHLPLHRGPPSLV